MALRRDKPWITGACAGFPHVAAAVALRQPARTPAVLFGVNPYCATVAGVRYSDCMLDEDVYVECIVRLADRFRPDCLLNVGQPVSGQLIARTDLVELDGVRHLRDRRSGELVLRIPDDGNPQPLRAGQLASQLPRPVPLEPESISVPSVESLLASDSFSAVREVLARLGGRLLISKGVTNASNAVVSWLGLERTCLLMREDPGLVRGLAERATDRACVSVRAQARLGLRLFYTGGSWGSLFGPRDYATFFADSQVRINRTVHECGGLALLHLTGRQSHLSEANLASQPDIVLADEDAPEDIARVYRGRV